MKKADRINFINPLPLINFHMPYPEDEYQTPLFTNPLEPVAGLTISDLNRYLPAILKAEDISMTGDTLTEGLFLADALEGLSRLPDNCIDLIITTPPEQPNFKNDSPGQKYTLQEFYQWSRGWLREARRVLKASGSIYLATSWHYSGMYQSLISDFFQIQTRISWRSRDLNQGRHSKVWSNETADMWFATKTSEFSFNKSYLGKNSAEKEKTPAMSNFWSDLGVLGDIRQEDYDDFIPQRVIERVIRASTFKLSWVLDPFTRYGATGIGAKTLGRRFIGLEQEQDNLLISMKRIDQT